jgi:hypothetical protein
MAIVGCIKTLKNFFYQRDTFQRKAVDTELLLRAWVLGMAARLR